MGSKSKTYASWREKLENPVKGLPKVVDGPPQWQKRFGGRRVLVATPLLVDGLIRKVGRGQLVTVRLIRECLATDFSADSTCPLTTGIFISIAAHTAEEDLQKGVVDITPYWRVIKDDGSLNVKFPGGVSAQAAHLREEGHAIEPGKGKKPPVVQDFNRALVEL
ncbi:hypothetical protein ACFLUH_03740 [Chloroflexota bacterium]